MFKKRRMTKLEKREQNARIRNRKKNFIFFKNCLIFIIVILSLIGLLLANDGYKLYKNVTNKISIEDKVNEIRNSDNYVTLDNVSNYYKEAVVAIEDHRFYQHLGFDPISTMNAFISNINSKSLSRGGSTITQQVAKNMYFDEKKVLTRKIAELFVSFNLEHMLSKDEILELYINIIYFGDGYYGIYNAAKGYYKKRPSKLNLDESMMLAGVVSAPSVYSPTINSKLANKRLEQVRSAMIKYGYIEKVTNN